MRFFLILLVAVVNIASADHHGDHKALGAHVHGHMSFSVAVDGNTVGLELDGPSEGILGFEHAPKSAAERKIWEDFEKKWKEEVIALFALSKELGCVQEKDAQAKLEVEGKHADLEAQASLKCAQSPSGTKAQLLMLKSYKGLKELEVNVLTDKGATKTILKGNAKVEIQL